MVNPATVVVLEIMVDINLTWVANSAPDIASEAAVAARLIFVLRDMEDKLTTLFTLATKLILVVKFDTCCVVQRIVEFNVIDVEIFAVVVLEQDIIADSSAEIWFPAEDIGLELIGKNPSMLSLYKCLSIINYLLYNK